MYGRRNMELDIWREAGRRLTPLMYLWEGLLYMGGGDHIWGGGGTIANMENMTTNACYIYGGGRSTYGTTTYRWNNML